MPETETQSPGIAASALTAVPYPQAPKLSLNLKTSGSSIVQISDTVKRHFHLPVLAAFIPALGHIWLTGHRLAMFAMV